MNCKTEKVESCYSKNVEYQQCRLAVEELGVNHEEVQDIKKKMAEVAQEV